MALQVGELVAMLGVDTRTYDRDLRQAEQTLRQADRRMEAEAEQSGQRGGQALGGGYVRGADGQWRDMRAQLVDAVTAATLEAETAAMRGGRQIGTALGDGMEHEARQAGEDAGEQAGQGLAESGEDGADTAADGITERLKSGLKAGVVGIGAMAGALLMTAFSDAMDQGKAVGKLTAQLGATPAQAERYGQVAGKLYTGAITEEFSQGTDAIRAAMQSGLLPPDATNKQIESISRKVVDLSTLFDVDLADAATGAGQLIRTGLVKDASEGLDLIGKAFQMNDKRADDMLDTLTEYPTQFRDLGINGATAFGIMQQGLEGGARDTDIVADAMKELNIRVKDLSAADGLKKLGIDAKEASRAFNEGGPKAAEMLDTITDRLREVKDPTDRFTLAQQILGTQSEDLAGALMSIDPSEASKKMGDFKGTVDRAGNSLRDNASTKVEQFKRGIQQNVVDFLGTTVIPALTDFGGYVRDTFGKVWDDAGKGADTFGERVANFMSTAGGKIAEVILTEWIPNAVNALPMLGVKMAEYFMKDPVAALKILAIAGAIVLGLMYLPEILIGSLAAVAGLILGGLVQKLVEATTEKLPLWWAAFKSWVGEKAGEAGQVLTALGTAISDWFGGLWDRYIAGPTSRAWDSWVRYVQGIPGRTVQALATLGLKIAQVAVGAWQRFRDGAVSKVSGMIRWVKDIPGRIKSALGNAGLMLYSAGRDVVIGLWNGIKSMGGWLFSTLTGWALDQIPAPIAKALGIASPSRLMADEIGRWIPAGVVEGIESGQGAVDDAMSSLVSTPAIGSPMVGAAGGGGALAGAGGAASGVTVVRLELAGPREMQKLLRGIVADAGGSVQVAFGR